MNTFVVGTMKHDRLLGAGPGAAPCRQNRSRLPFREPAHQPCGGHVAFLGGARTLGRPVERPFPALIEEETGVACVNFGVPGASADAFLLDLEVPGACGGAALTVLEAMDAAGLSNPFYAVHPRRNDRFVRAHPALRALYPEVDLAEVCFTGHLLRCLRAAGPERFDIVREALQTAWIARMRALIDRVGGEVLLLWLRPEEDGAEPPVVTPALVDELRPHLRGVVEVPWGPQTDAAAHREVAAALSGPVRASLGTGPEEVRAFRSVPGRP